MVNESEEALNMKTISLAVLLCLAISSIAFADDTAFKKGEEVFNRNCAKCHGEKGSGTDKGPPLIHKIYHPNHHSDLSFRWAVERGARSHHWRFGDMPKIDGVSKEDTEKIIIYVRTLQKEAGIF